LQGLEQIYVASPDNHVHVVNVKLGPQSGGDWIIESGLKPGDRVITDNVQKLRDGAPISPHEVSAEAAVLTSNPTGGR
jgi:membrane fusion protein (multidrug efflux system)